VPDSPASRAKQIEPAIAGDAAGGKDETAGIQSGDKIVRVNDKPVGKFRDLVLELARAPGEPLAVTVSRTAKPAEGAEADDCQQSASQEITFEVPARPLEALGLVMQAGPIVAVQPNSPAAAASLAAGDTIVGVNSQPFADAKSLRDWTPDTLSELMRQAAVAGETVTLAIEREGKPLDVTVTPRVPNEFHSVGPPRAPVGVPALGIAFGIENKVVAVIAESPAAAAKIKPGDTITAAEFVLPKSDQVEHESESAVVELSADEPSWPAVIDELQRAPAGTTLQLTVERGEEKLTKKVTPVAVENLFVADRGFLFMPIERVRRATSFSEQVQYGWDETTDALGMVFRFLEKIGTQVPVTALGGPITIAKAAGYSAYDGLPALLIFLTMLSANLAVLNFLPIPLLDGGHMAFLAYEGVRGRPASEKFVVALHTIGFVFIVSLMLFVVALDLDLIPRNL
jgi:regulator of sigma E protease